jgi:hypothetical protein
MLPTHSRQLCLGRYRHPRQPASPSTGDVPVGTRVNHGSAYAAVMLTLWEQPASGRAPRTGRRRRAPAIWGGAGVMDTVFGDDEGTENGAAVV